MSISQSILNNFPSFLYMNGFVYSSNPNNVNQIIIQSGSCRDSNNFTDIVSNANIIVDITRIGINGIDVNGPVSRPFANYTYGLCVISDSSGHLPVQGIAYDQVNQSNPYLPSGYDSFRLIGYFYVNSSKHVESFSVFGNSTDRKFKFDTPVLQISSSSITITPTVFNLSNIVPGEIFFNASDNPDLYQLIDFRAVYVPHTSNNIAYLGNFLLVGPSATHTMADTLEISIFAESYIDPDLGGLPGISCSVTENLDALSVYVCGYKFYT